VDYYYGGIVGGSSSGWELVDPMANMHALGIATPADYAASQATFSQPMYGPAASFGATNYFPTDNFNFGSINGGGGIGNAYGSSGYPANAYGSAMGGGYVGGSWSPEPVGNNQILYGHYSSQGAIALPQAYYGQQATSNPAAFATPAVVPTAAAPAATASQGAKPATTTAGGDKPATDTKPKTDTTAAKKTTTADKKPDAKPEPKTVTVKSGDTLSEIAQKHGTTVDKLYALNKGVIGGDKNLIKPGQELKLPS
jgi:LysM repeat protein